ncbi:hypothetical protein GCM10022276_21010 [Sphingomonas limnosediminicola]|jgi:hypothetical protein|uniref:Uncharacterized protein n=1 Tax=Sphingomonas limnosediminicola TaxID=940133 RepID=A0ABP7LJH5_9SPHN
MTGRSIHLSMKQDEVVARCLKEKINVSTIERLSSGGVRLVCSSSSGADRIRQLLKSKIISGEVVRERHRPKGPIW